MTNTLPINQILHGDSLAILPTLPAESIDVIFADPPYNLQLKKALWRPNLTPVDAVDDAWDRFDSFAAYDAFTQAWLAEAQRILKPRSSIWISGTYHNIHRIGAIMQTMGFWLLNTITWFKPNAMPNFNGQRLKNDVEFLIWAKKSEDSRYTINYQLLKRFNDGKQSGAVWQIPICSSKERLRLPDGEKLHSTQKPEELLRRVLLASARPNHIVLDPFSGSGTTAAVAKSLHMRWIGIERETAYIAPSRQRIEAVQPLPVDDEFMAGLHHEKPAQVKFSALVRAGYLQAGETLYLDKTDYQAKVLANGKLTFNGTSGTIHSLSRKLKNVPSCNGWKQWRYEDTETGELLFIDELRQRYRANGVVISS